MKNFVTELVYRFNISEDQSRVAVIQFSSEEQTAVTFFFDDYNYDKDSLMNRINDITQSDGGQTSTHVALRMAREQVGRHSLYQRIKIHTEGPLASEAILFLRMSHVGRHFHSQSMTFSGQ